MGCYTYAEQFLNKVKNSGINWGKTDETPDNMKESYLRIYNKYGLNKQYVNGVYDALNKCGQYKIAKEILGKKKINWNFLGSSVKDELLRGTGLDIDYVEGVADAIYHEKLANAKSNRKKDEDIVL